VAVAAVARGVLRRGAETDQFLRRNERGGE